MSGLSEKAGNGEAGFTLLEALLALALSGVIIYALAMISAQWMPNWRHGFADVQRADILSLGIERIVADLESAEFVTPNNSTKDLVFQGGELSVIFVRSALGPNAAPHLEVVRFSETVDDRGFVLVRSRASFAPLPNGSSASSFNFVDPVVLVRAPFRVSFAYAGPDRIWRNAWGPSPLLPTAVRITVRDAATQQVLAASTAAQIHADVAPDCMREKSPSQCATNVKPGGEGAAAAQQTL